MHSSILLHIVLLLLITIITVSIGRRLHIPTLLSYILAGAVVGPYGLKLIQNADEIQFLAEFGIVFLLFSIGLEFSLSKMIAMRKQVFVLGTAQVFITAIIVYIICILLNIVPITSIAIASTLALSSTAIVIKQLTEQSEIQSRHGKSAVGILIFQDIIAIPLLILIPVLGASGADNLGGALTTSLINGLIVAGVVFLISRYLLRPLFKEVASAKSSELFMLTILSVVLGAAWFTQSMGISMTLGAFLAGMMLGETEYRHQIESDIRPFQDILLGLFFVTIGMMISPTLIWDNLSLLILITLSTILLKGVVIFGMMVLFKKPKGVAMRTALSLSQVGEFGLVLVALALSVKIIENNLAQIIMTSAVLSMMLSSFLIKFNGKITKKLFSQSYGKETFLSDQERIQDTAYLKNHVVICGFGRVGQTAAKFLKQSSIPFVAIDLDIKRVQEAKQSGEPVHYGDSSKQNILNAIHIQEAKVAIITFADYHASLKILQAIHLIRPDLPVLVRTRDDAHVNDLIEAGATEVIPDIFESSIMLSSHLLLMAGVPPSHVLRKTREVRMNRYRFLDNFYPGETDLPTQKEHQVMGQIIQPITIEENAYAVGKSLSSLYISGIQIEVLAIKRGTVRGEHPAPETKLRKNDILVVAGQAEEIERFTKVINLGPI